MFVARFVRLLGAAGLAALAAASTIGCGDDENNDLPDGVVAKVGNAAIDTSDFKKRMLIASAYTLGRPPPYRLSDYRRCVTYKLGESPRQPQRPRSKESLLKECREEHGEARAQAMQSLVLAEWLDQEARIERLKATPREIREALYRVKLNQFGSVEEYEQFTRQSRIPESFFLEQARGQVLTEKLMRRARATAPAPTRQAIAAYYAKNGSQYRLPPGRELRLVRTKAQAAAQQARRALDRGDSWDSVVRKYTVDAAARRVGGKVPGFVRQGADIELESAVFAAPRGVVKGPLKGRDGWYVFEVLSVRRGLRAPLKDVTADIRTRLTEERGQQALDRYTSEFASRFQSKTVCADGYKISECRNGPKPRPDDSAPAPHAAQASQ